MVTSNIILTTQNLLGPIGLLSKYKECFDKNLCKVEENVINIEKLKQIRIRHLPSMNITNFQDQLAIMNRIRLVLTRDTGALLTATRPCSELTNTQSLDIDETNPNTIARKERRSLSNCFMNSFSSQPKHRKRTSRGADGFRRHSIDFNAAMSQIYQMRRELNDENREEKLLKIRRHSLNTNQNSAALLINGDNNKLSSEVETNKKTDTNSMRRVSDLRVRRNSVRAIPDKGMLFNQSLSEKAEQASRRELGIYYGASAQRVANAQYSLTKVISKVMNRFKKLIPCERCSILFLNDSKEEIFFFDTSRNNMKRYSFQQTRGIAGYVALNLITVNIPDAYSDERFDRSLDEQTGFKTKSILCTPIRNTSGKCVAVIQMLNKRSDDGSNSFSEEDESTIQVCGIQVAEALDIQTSMHMKAQNDMADLVIEERINFKSL